MITPRFVSRDGMLLAGIRQHHAVADAPRDVPQQWTTFNATALRAGATVCYGVTCAFDAAAQRMEYLCAVEIASFDGLPEGMGRMRVPPAHYAVFDVSGPASAIPATWGQVMQWEATNGVWEDAHTPAFERYDGEHCSIWLPVRPRTA